MAEIKELQFDDGTTVTPPSDASDYFVKNKFNATTNPTVTDDEDSDYVVGSHWVNVSTDESFLCTDATAGVAVWKSTTTTVTNLAVSTKDENYTTTNQDGLILINALSNDITITLHTASGNSGNRLNFRRIDDTDIKTDDFVDGDVTVGTDNINISSHTFIDLQKVQLTTSGVLPSGLALLTDYYIIYVDSNNIKLANSKANAVADTAVDIVSASGGGTHTITSEYNTVTIDANGSETIEGFLSYDIYQQYEFSEIVSDGSNWVFLEKKELTCYIKDVKGNGTAGGTFTLGAWRSRIINTLSNDTNFVTLDTESGTKTTGTDGTTRRFILPAGEYKFKSKCPAHLVNIHRSKLISDPAGSPVDIFYGDSVIASTVGNVNNNNLIKGTLKLTTTTTFEIQHNCSFTRATDGFGYPSGFGIIEIYTEVEIIKII